MRKEAKDMSIKEMQKAIYMKQEKTVDDIMISQIMKQGASYRPVMQLYDVDAQLGSSSSGLDEEDDTDIQQYKNKDDYMTDKKKQEMEMKDAIKAHKKWEHIVSHCAFCYDSECMEKDNLL